MSEENLKSVNIRVSPEVHSYFKERSRKTGASMSALMFLALEEHMKKEVLENRKFEGLIRGKGE